MNADRTPPRSLYVPSMKTRNTIMRILLAIACLLASGTIAFADNAVFTLLKTVPVAELDRILDEERAEFIRSQKPGAGYVLPPVSKATNPVEVYTVRYESRVPELGDRKIVATGLLAVPVVAGRTGFPLISYQHGTVYGKYEVPSFSFQKENPTGHPHYDGAYETRHMVAQFAGNGYLLMAADYFGMGGGADEPEAFFVKASAQQANYDLYRDVSKFLETKGIAARRLFLGGWSLGGLTTTGFLERLEQEGVGVTAAFTASAPNDPFASLNGFLFHPQPGVDAPWLETIVALSAFAYEHYHSEKDLARSMLNPRHYDELRSLYERSYGGPEKLGTMLTKLADTPLLDFFRDEYRDPAYFAKSAYGKRLAAAETYRQQFKAPLRMFCGTDDEAVREPVGRLASFYQGVLIGVPEASLENPVQVDRVPGGNHRLTFIAAAAAAKPWMDGLAGAAK
jgi:hypothetical protein